MNLNKRRYEHTTKGADPTVIVQWNVNDGETWIQTEEFQDVIQGSLTVGSRATMDLAPLIARLIHEGLEAEHELNERIRAENEPEERQ